MMCVQFFSLEGCFHIHQQKVEIFFVLIENLTLMDGAYEHNLWHHN